MVDNGQTFTIDAASHLCRITGRGMWTPADAKAHFEEIEEALKPLRSSSKPICFFVDMRGAAVQSRETAAAMSAGAARLHAPTDIVAVVTGTTLHALQVDAFSTVNRLKTFRDEGEARRWIERMRYAHLPNDPPMARRPATR